MLVNTIPRAAQPALGLRDLLGVGIWAGGLGLEILADSGTPPPPLLLLPVRSELWGKGMR